MTRDRQTEHWGPIAWWLVPTVVLIVAAVVRLWGIATPPKTIWDEAFYALDAQAYLGSHGPSLVVFSTIAGEISWNHPPVGKLMIAIGEAALPNTAAGWRIPSALFGIAAVYLVYLAAVRLWGSVFWGGLAALVVALDGLHVVQSRVAMLDIFVTTFLAGAFLLLFIDRSEAEQGLAARGTRVERALGGRPRFWAGVCAGAAFATKQSAVFVGAFAVVWCLTWVWRRSSSEDRIRGVAGVLLPLVLVPLIVYVASYAQFWVQRGPDVVGWAELQVHMVTFWKDLPEESWRSSPATWPLQNHPIRYSPPSGQAATLDGAAPRILALGNPIVWWGSLLLVPLLAWFAIRKREWRTWMILGFLAAGYLPWFFVQKSILSYYAVTCVPFLALAEAGALRELPAVAGRRAGLVFAGVVSLAGVLFLPLWIGAKAPWLPDILWLPGWRR